MRKLLNGGIIPGAVGGIVAALAYNIVKSHYDVSALPFRLVQETALTVVIFAVLGAFLGLLVGLLSMGASRLRGMAVGSSVETTASAVTGFVLAGGSLLSYIVLSAENPGSETFILAAVVFTTIAAFALMKIWRPDDSAAVRMARWIGVLGGGVVYVLWLRATWSSAIPLGNPGLALGLAVAVGIGWIFWYLALRLLGLIAVRRSFSAAAAIVAIVIAVPLLILSARGVWVMHNDHFDERAAELKTGGAKTSETNIILISVDTLRADSVGYAGGTQRTPTMDALAAQSHIFDNAYSVAPWTRPSFAAFFSSLYPAEMGVARIPGFSARSAYNIPYHWRNDRTLLPEIFRDRGYTTAAVVTNLNLAAASRADQGFDFFYNCATQHRAVPPIVGAFAKALYDPDPTLICARERERAEFVSPHVIKLLQRQLREPVFLWVHYMDPHGPYDPPTIPRSEQVVPDPAQAAAGLEIRTGSARQKVLNAYTAEIEYCDEWLLTVIDQLKADGLWDSSVVVFWSDHGEEFWEHGGWGHGQSLFNDQLRVPLLIHLPGQTDEHTINKPVTLLDVMPTILDYCDADEPSGMRGRSLLPLMDGRAENYQCRAFLEGCYMGGIRKGLLTGRWKLIWDAYQNNFSLYDMETDPTERHDIYGTALAPDTADMEKRLLEWADESQALVQEYVSGGDATKISPEIQQNLKDMGYIQ